LLIKKPFLDSYACIVDKTSITVKKLCGYKGIKGEMIDMAMAAAYYKVINL